MAVAGTVDAAAQSIRDNAKAVIQQLEQSFGISSFRARQDLAYLIAEIDDVAIRQQGKLLSQLNKQERQLFVDSNNLLVNARRQADGTLQGVQKVAETMEGGVSRLPLADRSPRVLRARPEYLVTQAGEGAVSIRAEGSLLGSGPAILRIGDQKCALAAQTETAVTFQCAAAIFRTKDAPTTVTSDLEVTAPRGFLDVILFRPAKIKKYHLATVVAPAKLGTYTIEGAYDTTVRETQPRDGRIEASNEHCQGERVHGPFRFSATPGWSVDPASIREGTVHGTNRQASIEGPHEVAFSGFYYNAKLKNGGECVKVLGKIVSYDARAWRNQDVLWTEYRDVDREQPLALAGAGIAWGGDVSIALPPRMKWFRVKVRQIDGQERVIIDRDEKNDWFSLDHDAEQRTIVIRPRSLDEALALR
ncbi:hypothetical protein OVA11_19510 [Caulobacter sp. SL161]|uniref:hypothetical protein n=1 Tax=Caulobacter sp. SL161 TaxID=2995156 RepID=UPI002273DB0B|nr:hypothetical protein [Caulobacter sp. SL161]MCY1649165.1 hypothetical protein [Caulobacter sp. SL161]